jgi:hypothetical protein
MYASTTVTFSVDVDRRAAIGRDSSPAESEKTVVLLRRQKRSEFPTLRVFPSRFAGLWSGQISVI